MLIISIHVCNISQSYTFNDSYFQMLFVKKLNHGAPNLSISLTQNSEVYIQSCES